jgi:DNA-directed RNA polymerase specialized sigma24 family protein
MFRGYQSKARHWEIDPPIRIEINTLAAHEIEKIVSALPDKHRSALRWCYVFDMVPVIKVRQHLGVTNDALLDLVDSARDMVKNRLHSS